MDFDTTEILLFIENKLHIFNEHNVLHIELFEDCLTDTDNDKMHNILDVYYDNYKESNKKFNILYDFTNLSLTSMGQITLNISTYNNHFNKHIGVLRKNLKNLFIVINNSVVRETVDSILDLYQPEIKPILIENTESLSKYIK